MTDRDRLKENIKILNSHNLTKKPVLHLSNGRKYEFDVINEIVEDVSLILEKLENGLLIELPCKVGDMVYCLIQGFENPLKATINRITVQVSGVVISCSVLGYFGQSYMATDFGKTVFLTKEEAEQALSERK